MVKSLLNQRLLYLAIPLFFNLSAAFSQTCTLSGGPISWDNASPPACNEGGNANTPGKTVLVIPAGVTVNFDDNTDTWTGTRIEVYGTLNVSKNIALQASIAVFNGGLFVISGKVDLGSGGGCPYTITIYTGGTVDVGSTGSDRLSICGVNLMNGNDPQCNPCSVCAYNGHPYCEPAGGFTGPLGYSETGYNGTLPVRLLYFTATLQDTKVNLNWATTAEEDFGKFIVERSSGGIDFEAVGEVPGMGRNIYDIQSTYEFIDRAPLLGFNYYRLKAVDLDSKYEYFGVVVVKLSGAKQVSVYPNPASGKSISFDINFNPTEGDQVMFINSLGIELRRQLVSEFENEIAFDNDLSPGVYLLKYLSHDFESTSRVMVR